MYRINYLISLTLLMILNHNLFGSTEKSVMNTGLRSTAYVQRHMKQIRPVIGNIGIIVDSKISNGKEIAEAYASELGASFFAYSGYTINAVSSQIGENEIENLQSIFFKAKESAPAVLFISEFTNLAGSESYLKSASKGAMEFVRLMKEIVEEKNGVTVVVSDSNISKLDPFLWKEKSFSAAISVDTMNTKERAEILRFLADKSDLSASDLEFEKLSSILDCSVIADLEKIISDSKGMVSVDVDSLTDKIISSYKRFSKVQEIRNVQETNDDKGIDFTKEYDAQDFEIKKSTITLDNIIGMKREKEQINEILRYFKEPEFFTKHGVYSPKGILLYGPPGNGKTYLARAIAGEVGANFIATTGADLEGGIGKSGKISKLFAEARKNSPTVIFIDEFETIAGHRKQGLYSDKNVSKLLTEMDGVDSEANQGVFIIAATNHISTIDDAVLRPGRFDRHISIKIPQIEDRIELLTDFLDSLSITFDGDLNELAQLTAGLSIAHIRNLVNESALIALKSEFEHLNIDHFKAAKIELKDRLSKAPASDSSRWFGNEQQTFEFIMPEQLGVKLSDINGLEGPKSELLDLLDFIKDPEKLSSLGAKPTRGVTLYGPPGTGKTMLARGLAAEAGVSFISATGAQLSGWNGPEQVKHLFTLARSLAPCIIFIDEVETAMPRRTVEGIYSDKSVSQFLSEMDGIDPTRNDNVFIVMATNHINKIDEAVLRPGRVDRKIHVSLPTASDRVSIIDFLRDSYLLDDKISSEEISKMTMGWTPADIKNLLNEAAIAAGKIGRKSISLADILTAKTRIKMGHLKPINASESELLTTAYHESGHALAAILLSKLSEINKLVETVTILARDDSLGHTAFQLATESYSLSKKELLAEIVVLLSGRAAEEIHNGPEGISTGASNDLQRATEIAKRMVLEFGFSNFGLMVFDSQFMSNDSEIPAEAKEEIKRILEDSYKRSLDLLTKNQAILDSMAKTLLEEKTVSGKKLNGIVESFVK